MVQNAKIRRMADCNALLYLAILNHHVTMVYSPFDLATNPINRITYTQPLEQQRMERTHAPEYIPMMRDLPMDLRPRERMLYAGPSALSTAELLAIILRVGNKGENVIRMAERLLAQLGGVTGLAQANFEELCALHGMGEAKATQIKAALELGKRLSAASPQDRLQVRSPADVANLLMLEMGLLEQEQLRAVLLDTKNFVSRVTTVYTGSLNTTVVRVAEVFREAIRANSAGIIIVHNHPSGDPTPSPEDVRVTEMLVQAGALLDISVLDHLVIGRNRYVSMKERGLGFK
jgi:DNA repair protein RadC